jgi:hypothetical protein
VKWTSQVHMTFADDRLMIHIASEFDQVTSHNRDIFVTVYKCCRWVCVEKNKGHFILDFAM